MTRSLDLVRLSDSVDMRKNRISGSRFVRSINVFAPCNGHLMTIFCSTFCNQEEVIPIFFVDMRRLGITSACTVPNHNSFGGLMPVAHEIRLPIFIPENGRINSSLVHPDRFAPFACRIFCRYIKVSSTRDVGDYHIEESVMITDRGGIDSS